MDTKNILSRLPYSKPFLFVDAITHIDENGVVGTYTFSEVLDFYRGHFKSTPVTPGVILTECCAQIGLVCLGIYLMQHEKVSEEAGVAMSSAQMEFYKPVFPGEKVTVRSEKLYFRFNKLKCKVALYNEKKELVCKGELSGMFSSKSYG
ncbi:MAG: hydroxymyristoyl-ACP dehydratase [Eudoraea sp.]|nr:hydroxymyristoyl-ACP dehydratase [Eudoraea sp.]MBT8222529.1 hydroxymyristoyl-ACP dehydratase [Eudoraea sp.]NNK30569.1 hydroxymyristoyl-ACP dehydratase [Flavobacteriaceae bacterium]